MSTAAVIAIVVAVVVVLAAVSFFTLARRSDVRGAGALSGETVRLDRDARSTAVVPAPTAATASEVEAAGTAARTSTAVATIDHEAPIVPWTPPDPEVIGESRRAFFNRATVGLMSIGIVTFAAAAFVGFLWPTGKGGFGGLVTVG